MLEALLRVSYLFCSLCLCILIVRDIRCFLITTYPPLPRKRVGGWVLLFSRCRSLPIGVGMLVLAFAAGRGFSTELEWDVCFARYAGLTEPIRRTPPCAACFPHSPWPLQPDPTRCGGVPCENRATCPRYYASAALASGRFFVRPWLPQGAALAHPNIRAAVSACCFPLLQGPRLWCFGLQRAR